MKLVKHWRKVALHSWSFRINAVLCLLSSAEAGVTYWVDGKASAAIAVAGFTLATGVARLVKQVTLSGRDADE